MSNKIHHIHRVAWINQDAAGYSFCKLYYDRQGHQHLTQRSVGNASLARFFCLASPGSDIHRDKIVDLATYRRLQASIAQKNKSGT